MIDWGEKVSYGLHRCKKRKKQIHILKKNKKVIKLLELRKLWLKKMKKYSEYQSFLNTKNMLIMSVLHLKRQHEFNSYCKMAEMIAILMFTWKRLCKSSKSVSRLNLDLYPLFVNFPLRIPYCCTTKSVYCVTQHGAVCQLLIKLPITYQQLKRCVT